MQVAVEQLIDRKWQVRFEVSKAFAEALAKAATLQAVEEGMELAKQTHQISVARVKEGEAAAVEKSISEVELNRLIELQMEGSVG